MIRIHHLFIGFLSILPLSLALAQTQRHESNQFHIGEDFSPDDGRHGGHDGPSWRRPQIFVETATYGGNCGAPPGNVTGAIAASCDGRGQCSYPIDVAVLGDPAYLCRKDLTVNYRCDGRRETAYVTPEAHGQMLYLDCRGAVPRPRGMQILSATYGANCRAAHSNATFDVARQCDGVFNCDYRVDVRRIGDPAFGCAKDFLVEYQCGRDPVRQAYLRPEANGQVAFLQCR